MCCTNSIFEINDVRRANKYRQRGENINGIQLHTRAESKLNFNTLYNHRMSPHCGMLHGMSTIFSILSAKLNCEGGGMMKGRIISASIAFFVVVRNPQRLMDGR